MRWASMPVPWLPPCGRIWNTEGGGRGVGVRRAAHREGLGEQTGAAVGVAPRLARKGDRGVRPELSLPRLCSRGPRRATAEPGLLRTADDPYCTFTMKGSS